MQKRTSEESSKTIFLSFSGDRGKRVATALAEWLPLVLPQAKPWVAPRNIEAGREFFSEITSQVSSANVCIICLTPDTPNSTWVAFEAGLAYANPKCKVYPIAVPGFSSDTSSPLGLLHFRSLTQDDMIVFLEEIRRHLGIDDAKVAARVKGFWGELRQDEPISAGSFPYHTLRLAPVLENRASDLAVSNAILLSSTSLHLLALTYKSLADSITSMKFPNLGELSIRAYAVPTQRHSHPVHIGNYTGLIQEWTESITRLLEAFCNRERCPQLETIDFVLLSSTPSFTGTYAQWQDGELRGQRLRMTLCVSGIQMAELPTFILDAESEGRSQSFPQFKDLFLLRGQKPSPPLTFTLFTRHSTPAFIERFVERASSVSLDPNSPDNADAHFYLNVVPLDPHPPETITARRPHDIPGLAQGPLAQPSTSEYPLWIVYPDYAHRRITIALAGTESAQVETLHFFANFVALLVESDQGYDLVLVNHCKAPWDYDVPGGKFTKADKDAASSACREIFEELGWLLEPDQLRGPVGLNYDPRAAREGGVPGVIQYFYCIVDKNRDWHCGDTRPGYNTKGHSLRYYPLNRLIAEKRARMREDQASEPLCHLPLKVLKAIAEEVQTAQ